MEALPSLVGDIPGGRDSNSFEVRILMVEVVLPSKKFMLEIWKEL